MAAWCCLGAMLGSLSWLGPLAVVLVATLDGSHASSITAQGTGVAVVLHHELPGAQPVRGHDRSFGHQHCLAASVLASLAGDASSRTDHVIQFAGGAANFTKAQSVRPAPQTLAMTAPVSPDTAALISLSERTAPLHPRPPPVLAALLLQVRSTVLLV
ncbi:MAG: hypothetical protein FD161_2867 [Limisphaerales bacterium]|nr:MAG: hypothetical protein FD161_2867 [Limisphaerales bacterium]KAG0508220.1 MAG: hypothetical protein E1N63_2618 [Limisphaerales bacterium]TXT51683.1 MAG: hypothetical protein FD140_1487 [Limisphaerales bacterium]